MRPIGFARVVSACFFLSIAAHAQLVRVPNTTLAMPPSPPTFGYTTTNAFPGLIFTNPICLVTPPGETNRLFIVGKNGLIAVITNLEAPNWNTFMDLTPQVSSQNANSGTAGERGLIGMAFHPGFATNGYFYLIFMPTNAAAGGYFDRLARFQVSPGTPNQCNTNTQVVFYDQVDPDPNHNAGDIHFGADGYLYASVGDEGIEHDGFFAAQVITNSLFSGLLRIDVDKRPGNLTPNASNPSLTVSTNYLIPADNPFIGITIYNGLPVNPNLVRTEFYAVGLRNPWRWNFDFNTNAFGTNVLYCGDVGQDHYEELDVIQKGDNDGWAYWEGTNIASGGSLPHDSYIATSGTQIRFPIVQYAHGTATNMGNCIIGGVVYRGSNLPQLYGNYIYGDYVDGNIWMLVASNFTTSVTSINGSTGPSYPIIQDTTLNVTAFGTDPRNGDVLMCATKTTGYATDATINKIIYNSSTSGTPLPPTLYDTGAFTNLMSLTGPLNTLKPAAGITPYTINLPFWSDNAIKSRWISVPNTNLTIGFNPNGNWSFPTGTVWIKHFNLQLTNGDPSSQIRLETRLLVKNSSGIYGVSYRWGGSTTNATLVSSSGMDENFTINNGGVLTTQTWHYPSQNECLACHTSAGGFGLGTRTEQLNCSFDYGAGPTNQIQAMSAAGYFSSLVTNDPAALLALAAPTNNSASLEFRSRSFLSANCSQCHQPAGTVSQANWDARITTPTALAGLINAVPINNLGNASNCIIAPLLPSNSVLLARISTRGANSIQMPPLASNVVDSDATNVITQWILSLTNQFWLGAAPDPQTVFPGSSTNYAINFVVTGDFTNNVNLSVSGLPSGTSGVFSPTVVSSAVTNSTLTISSTGATPVGTYLLTITGIGGGITNTDTMTLNVSTVITAAPGQLWWTDSSGTDTNWSTSLNWTNITTGGYGPPGISNDLVFNNAAAGPTNFVDTTTTANSLWYRLSPTAGGSVAQVTKINPGQTLNITGTNIITGSSFATAGYSLLVGTNNTANANGSSVSATITGAGGTLNISRPDGVVAVAQFNTAGNHPSTASTRANLDMSGLDNFYASVSQLLLGCMNNGSAGTLYLAKTNTLTIANGSATSLAGIDISDNGGNSGDPSFFYLGVSNRINAAVIRAGGQKGFWGVLAFNPAFNSQSPAAVFRGTGGDTSRVATWLIGDLIGATGSANVTCPRGTNDFTGGTVDILVDSLVLGKTGTGTESAAGVGISSNRVSIGTLTFNAGTVNVNNLTNGLQLAADLTDTGIGQINVNGSGNLIVNNKLVLAAGVPSSYVGGNFTGVTIVTNLYYGTTFNVTNAFAQGSLNVNTGTVLANSVVAGGGISIIALNNATFTVTNSAGSPTARIGTFAVTNSTLHFILNGDSIATNICVSNLVATGVSTIVVDSIVNVGAVTTFPLISYTGGSPVNGSFVKGSLPAGYSANLVNNTAQKRIDLVIAPTPTVTPFVYMLNLAGTNFVAGGTNGFPGGFYSVLTSTNIAQPLSQWLPISTNPFDTNGGFMFTNPMNPGSQQLFYLLQLQ